MLAHCERTVKRKFAKVYDYRTFVPIMGKIKLDVYGFDMFFCRCKFEV